LREDCSHTDPPIDDHGGAAGGAPTAAGGAGSILPPKPAVSPAQPLKRFHWHKLEEQHIEGTFWHGLDEQSVYEHNMSEFEALFARAAPTPRGGKKGQGRNARGGPGLANAKGKVLFVKACG